MFGDLIRSRLISTLQKHKRYSTLTKVQRLLQAKVAATSNSAI